MQIYFNSSFHYILTKVQDDEVRTLFVSGLPHDIKPREFQLLLYQYQGESESTKIKLKW